VDRCQARFAQAWLALGRGSLRHGSLSGADRSGVARSPWVGHDLSLTWHAAKQTVVDHIWEWNSVRTNSEHARIPASARRMPGAEGCRCESEDGVVVVVGDVVAVVVVSDVKIRSIKITPQRMNI